MRALLLISLGLVLIVAGVAALTALLAGVGAEVRGFGVILIGPIPIIVTDGRSLPLVLILTALLFLLALVALRRAVLGRQQG